MFQDILETVREHIYAVRLTTKTNNNLRDLINRQSAEEELELIAKLKQDIPSTEKSITYEHCAVVNSIFLVSEAYCQLAKIESIQVNDESTSAVQTTSEQEIGLKFDIEAKRGLRVYQCF